MKFTILERVTLIKILPENASYLTHKILADFKDALYLSEEEIKAYEFKFENYIEHLVDKSSKPIARESKGNIINNLRANKSLFKFGNIRNLEFLYSKGTPENFHKFLSFFTPRINKDFEFRSIQGDFRYFEQFEYGENQILIDLCRFIHDRKNEITIKESKRTLSNDYNLFTLFDMVETLL